MNKFLKIHRLLGYCCTLGGDLLLEWLRSLRLKTHIGCRCRRHHRRRCRAVAQDLVDSLLFALQIEHSRGLYHK